jgi:dTDP-4-amino-4,6-dideoxygalactose transaminase
MIPLFKVRMNANAAIDVGNVLSSGYIGEGPKVLEFEKALTETLNLPENRVVVVNSCTSALTLALYMYGIGPGDEVITTPITCTATNSPIVTLGAKIVWADVDPLTGNIDPEDVRQKITDRTKAIIAVDWAGRVCDYNNLRQIAEDYDIIVIQDAAHGPLVFDHNKPTGHIICLSFQAIKHLTSGDGGALVFNQGACDGADVNRARLLRWYGLDRHSDADFRCAQNIEEVGFKFHMNDINAAIGLANIKDTRTVVSWHTLNAGYLIWELSKIPKLLVPVYDDTCQYWVLTIFAQSKDERDELQKYLKLNGIMASQVHARNDKHSAFVWATKQPTDPLPGATFFDSRQLSIPCGWWLNVEDLDHIVETIKGFYNV